MAYTTLSIKLTDAEFPLLTELVGRTVFAPLAEERDNEHSSIRMVYCENVMPTNEGLKSVDFIQAIPPLVVQDGSYLALIPYWYLDLDPATYSSLATRALYPPNSQWGLGFVRILEIRGAAQVRAYIGVTSSGILFISTAAAVAWVPLNNEGWIPSATDIDNVSVATLLTGDTTETFICLPKFKVLRVNIAGKVLEAVTFSAGSNIVQAEIQGIVSSYNYLILHDGSNIQWSSAFSPLDFNLANALVSGTGFGTPIGLQGKITALVTNPAGFTVYSDVNAIDVDWSGNARFPWVFRPIPNSAGVSSARLVVVGEDNMNLAWTTQGLQAITAQNAKPVFPDVTDFLTFGKLETYDYTTNIITVTRGKLKVDVGYAGARYLIVSYGLESAAEFTQALIFDIALKRWGKVVVPHVDTVDYRLGAFNSPRSGIGFLASDGSVSVIDFSERLCFVDLLNDANFVIDFCNPGVWANSEHTIYETNATSFYLPGVVPPPIAYRAGLVTALEIHVTCWVNSTLQFTVGVNLLFAQIFTYHTIPAVAEGYNLVVNIVFSTPQPSSTVINISCGYVGATESSVSHLPAIRLTRVRAT